MTAVATEGAERGRARSAPPLVVSVPEAARLLGVSTATAWRMIAAGTFPAPALRIGRRVVVSRAALERFAAGGAESRAAR